MSIYFSCVGAAIGSGGHNLVFSALKNGNQGQKLMSITVIFNGNCLFEPTSPLKLKIPHALIKLVLKIAFNAAKSVILLIFHLKIQIQGQ